MQLEFGEIDGLITSVSSRVTDYDERVDVALGKDSQCNLRIVRFRSRLLHCISVRLLERRNLKDVGYHIAVRYHDGFLHSSPLISVTSNMDSQRCTGRPDVPLE